MTSNRSANESAADHNREQSDRLAVVTGAGRRLGKAIALRLAQLGYDIALHFHSSAEEAAQVAHSINALGRRCETFQRDLGQFEEARTLIDDIADRMGAPTLLVNSASVYQAKSFLDSRSEDFDINFNLHVKAAYFLTAGLAKRCPGEGLVINMVDTGICSNKTNYFPYLLSKKTLFELTKMTAQELAPQVRVNAIAPGLVKPDTSEKQGHELSLSSEQWEMAVTAADILQAVEYLINNSAVSGQCLYVDKGRCVNL